MTDGRTSGPKDRTPGLPGSDKKLKPTMMWIRRAKLWWGCTELTFDESSISLPPGCAVQCTNNLMRINEVVFFVSGKGGGVMDLEDISM